MMDDDNDNIIPQVEEPNDFYEFKYDFISMPWDDRTTTSKIGIVSLLVTILAATFACVVHNFVMHFGTLKASRSTSEIKCHLVKVDEYRYVARIHSISTQELLCVGAIVSPKLVIANGVCVKAGPIRLRVGSTTGPRCKKGFSVDVIEPIYHEGTVSKHLVLLITYENMAECVQVISIGDTLDWESTAYIIGRPLRGGRSLSRQPVKLIRTEDSNFLARRRNFVSMLCVKDMGKCPVRAGDLLVQGGHVFGLASTSTYVTAQTTRMACFADLRLVIHKLSEHEVSINLQSLEKSL